jgi:hypothetical protein
MNKEFIAYEQAVALKELGFDEPCFGWTVPNNENFVISPCENYNGRQSLMTQIPIYQQAFRWFREKYNFEYQIIKSANGNYSVVIHLNTQEYLDKISTQPYACIEEVTDCYSYEEAELACLNKLIEILKNERS